MAFSGGTGSSLDPYLISNTTDLQNLYTVSGGTGLYFLQTNDIVVGSLSYPFNSNGTTAYVISYTYDGAGYKLKDGSLYLAQVTTNQYPSLFGYLGASGILKNIKCKNITIERIAGGTTANAPVACLVGKNLGTISNCVIESDCKVSSTATQAIRLGGITGDNLGAVGIFSCENHGLVSANHTDSYVGGIAGTGGYIYNCYNTGVISNIRRVGGIVGVGVSSISTHIIAETCYNSGIIKGDNYVGGIAGYVSAGIISKCFALQGKIVKITQNPSLLDFGRITGGKDVNGSVVDCYALSTMALSNGWL